MYHDSVKEIVKSTIAEVLGVDIEDVTLCANLVNDLGCDSLDIVELIIAFERIFEISIPDELVEKTPAKYGTVDYCIKTIKNLKI